MKELHRTKFYKKLGKRIRFFRKRTGISQHDLANAINLSYNMVNAYENANSCMTIGTLLEIAKVLNINITELLPRVE